jgi:hypothetical protein
MELRTDSQERALDAVREIADANEIGHYQGVVDVDGVSVLQFASAHPGYVGWHWSVAFSTDGQSIDEVWLEPGNGALVAKPWTPWSDRIQPGDLAPGDVLPTRVDDPRLMPGYTGVDELDELTEPLRPATWSMGLGRERVLSPLGVDDAVDRWREGDNGPRTASARYSELPCASCGWLMTIGGRLGQAFGVCANALSPSDGRIVSLDHGCGAHSQTVVADGVLPVTELVIDEFEYDLIDRNSLPEPEPIDIEKLDLAKGLEPVEDIQDAVEEIDPEDMSAAIDSDSEPNDDSVESETPDQ